MEFNSTSLTRKSPDLTTNSLTKPDLDRLKAAIARELMRRGLEEKPQASGMSSVGATADTKLLAQSPEGRPGEAANALRDAQSSARSLGVTLHDTQEGHARFHQRLQTLVDVVEGMDLAPRDEAYLAHHAGKISEILAPLQAERNPISPLGGTEHIVREVDMILDRLESHVNAKGGDIQIGSGSEQLKAEDNRKFDMFLSKGGEAHLARVSGASSERPPGALPMNSPARALNTLSDAHARMSAENRDAYNQEIAFTDKDGNEGKVAPFALLNEVMSIGGRRLSIREQNAEASGEPAFNEAQRERILAVAGQIRELFAQPNADPEKLLELAFELREAVIDVVGPFWD